jgi:hypothetical protein
MQRSVLERQGTGRIAGSAVNLLKSSRNLVQYGRMNGNGIKILRSGSAEAVLTIPISMGRLGSESSTSKSTKSGAKIAIPSTHGGGLLSARNLSTGPRTTI